MGGFMAKSIKALVLTAAALGATVSISASASATERTISMYHVHTRESITITYWKDGRFIPSALNKLNWFLRDWRKNKAIRIDPRAIDLIYKLHADLGSKKPVQIICGYRSAATNAMLRRIGRHVARRSRHIVGQAIDFRFPDIPNKKVRNLALAYGIGGVGYYGRSGFIHIDTGSVRHWPRIPRTLLASIIRSNRPLIGRGYRKGAGTVMIASARRKTINLNSKTSRPVRMASASGPVPLVRLPAASGKPSAIAPRPRPRPYAVLLQAAAQMQIAPASAPATVTNFAGSNGSAHDQIGMIIANTAPDDTLIQTQQPSQAPARQYPRVNRTGKGDLAADIRNGKAHDVPIMRPLVTAKATTEKDIGWLTRVYATVEGMIRRNGAPVPLEDPSTGADPRLAAMTRTQASTARGLMISAANAAQPATQHVNRAGKGDLLTHAPLSQVRRQASLREDARRIGAGHPLNFE